VIKKKPLGWRRRLSVGILSASGVEHLKDAPLWVLNADYDFYLRKLKIAKDRLKKGRPAHKKYRDQELRLKESLSLFEAEIERRKEKGEPLNYET
jgi:predicted ribosome quality control (RQC) complex YloA/Tae2 family protein